VSTIFANEPTANSQSFPYVIRNAPRNGSCIASRNVSRNAPCIAFSLPDALLQSRIKKQAVPQQVLRCRLFLPFLQ